MKKTSSSNCVKLTQVFSSFICHGIRTFLTFLCALFIFGSTYGQTICSSGLTANDIVISDNSSLSVGAATLVTPAKASNLLASPPPVLAPYVSGTAITAFPYRIIFDGTFDVDQDIAFAACPNLEFTPGAKMNQQPSTLLTLRECKLRASCSDMWDGIVSAYSSCGLIVHRDTISDMEEGIRVIDGPKFRATDNVFNDNHLSIFINNAPSGYPAEIWGNSFATAAGLLPPYAGSLAEYGIYIYFCKYLRVGDNASSSGNSFTTMYNGIFIEEVPPSATYDLLNSQFTKITGASGTDALASGHKGAAIYGAAGPGNTTVVNVNSYTGTVSSFNSCDKGIVLYGLNANVLNTTHNNNVWGISLNGDGMNHHISTCEMAEMYYGVEIFDEVANASVDHVTVSTKSQINLNPWGSVNLHYPIGINITNPGSVNNNPISVDHNYITVNAYKGVGIRASHLGNQSILLTNTVNLYPPTAPSSFTATDPLDGLYIIDCKAATAEHNLIYGNANSFQTVTLGASGCGSYDQPAGIHLITSTPMILKCNETYSMSFGWRIQGGCASSGTTNIVGNKFNDHLVGIILHPNGNNNGTLGTPIGSNSADNHNQFFGSTYIVTGTGSMAKIYMHACTSSCNSTCTGTCSPKSIKTTAASSNITAAESQSNTGTCAYTISTPSAPSVTIYSCPAYRPGDTEGTLSVNNPISEAEESWLTLSPNPTTGKVVFNYSLPDNTHSASLRIVNFLGQLITERPLDTTADRGDLNLSYLPNGVYCYYLLADGARLSSGKVIIAR